MPHSDSVINSGLCGLPWNSTSVQLKSIYTVTPKMLLPQGEPHPHRPGPGSGWPLCRMPSHIKPRPKPQRESSAFRSSFMPFLPLSKFSRDPLPIPSFHCRFCLDPWGPQRDQRPAGSRDSQETDAPPPILVFLVRVAPKSWDQMLTRKGCCIRWARGDRAQGRGSQPYRAVRARAAGQGSRRRGRPPRLCRGPAGQAATAVSRLGGALESE